jgi:hypothetical protein
LPTGCETTEQHVKVHSLDWNFGGVGEGFSEDVMVRILNSSVALQLQRLWNLPIALLTEITVLLCAEKNHK